MTDEHLSQLSALVDGELTAHNALPLCDALQRDPALSATWERYHIMGQVLRGERVAWDARAVAVAVREQLRHAPPPEVSRAVSNRPRAWRSPFAGAALAAAAAFLAVFAVPSLYQGPESIAISPQPLVERIAVGGERVASDERPVGRGLGAAAAAMATGPGIPGTRPGDDPALATRPTLSQPAPARPNRRWQTDRDELASKLDLFVVNHQETAPAAGVKGVLPYVTLVGYETVR